MEVDSESVESRFVRICQEGDLVEADELWRQGLDINFASADGRTPLLAACAGGSLELVSALLSASADIEAVDKTGRGAALLAAESGQLDLLRWLIDQGVATLAECADDGSTILLCAATGGSTEMLAYLLGGVFPSTALATPSLDERDARGAHSLHCAAEAGELQALKELLRRGCRPDVVDDQGCCILHFAAAGGHVDIVQHCIKTLKINENVRDMDGDTPLIVAAFEGHTEVVQWLLQNGSSLEERNNEGMSACLAAAAGENPDVIEFVNSWKGGDGMCWMHEVEMHPELVLNFIGAGSCQTSETSMTTKPDS